MSTIADIDYDVTLIAAADAVRTAVNVPAPQAATGPVHSLAAGTAPAGPNYAAGETTTLLGKLNESSLRADTALIYGGSALRAVARGLTLAPVADELYVTVSAGHAILDGLVELAEDLENVALTAETWNHLWLSQAGVVQVVPTDLTPPDSGGPWVYLGAVETDSTEVVDIDYAGVVYERGGLRWRRTADTGVPGDTPPAGAMLYTRTQGGLYLWDGEAHQIITTGTAAPAAWNVIDEDDDYTLTGAYKHVRIDATGDDIEVTLPAAAGLAGQAVTIVKVDASANTVTIVADGTDTLNLPAGAEVLEQQWDSLTLRSVGDGWDRAA